ncbi:MAG TPA: hypothetical protein VIJ77_00030 [Candidatus Tumulicola sp.]
MPAYEYTAAVVVSMEGALSAARIETYLEHAKKGDPAATATDDLDLYLWNLQVSAAFQGPLHLLEVSLRNAAHKQLTRCFGHDWIDAPNFIHACILAQYPPPQIGQKNHRMGPDLLKQIHRTRNRIARAVDAKNKTAAKAGKPRIAKMTPSVNDIVAGLDFGFWTSMLDRSFDQLLWRTALHHAFPRYAELSGKPVARIPIAQRLNKIRDLRNRVMQHEPLFKRNLQSDFDMISEAIAWMYADVELWADHHSRWPIIQLTQAKRPETF